MSALFDEYVRCRNMQSGMYREIMRDHVDDDRLETAAALLGMGAGKISETDSHCLYDFTIYDLRRGGRTALESYVESLGGIDGVSGSRRRSLLKAMLVAKASCHVIESVDPAAHTVVLKDVIGGAGRATVHDRGISTSGQRGVGLFSRIVATPKISLLAGATLPFAPLDLQRAVSSYRRLEKRSRRRPEVKRYALFFRLCRKYGSVAHYMDARTGEVDES